MFSLLLIPTCVLVDMNPHLSALIYDWLLWLFVFTK